MHKAIKLMMLLGFFDQKLFLHLQVLAQLHPSQYFFFFFRQDIPVTFPLDKRGRWKQIVEFAMPLVIFAQHLEITLIYKEMDCCEDTSNNSRKQKRFSLALASNFSRRKTTFHRLLFKAIYSACERVLGGSLSYHQQWCLGISDLIGLALKIFIGILTLDNF